MWARLWLIRQAIGRSGNCQSEYTGEISSRISRTPLTDVPPTMRSIIETIPYFMPFVLAFGAACSSEGGTDKTSAATEKWVSLMRENWSLKPSSEEKDHCVKLKLTEDIYVSAIRPVAPKGTHHTF